MPTIYAVTKNLEKWKGLTEALQAMGRGWSGHAGEEGSSPPTGTAAPKGREAPSLSLPPLTKPQVKNQRPRNIPTEWVVNRDGWEGKA